MIARTLVLLALLAFVGPDAAAFDVGGSGELGTFEPLGDIEVVLPPDGVLDYTSVHVPVGVVVTFRANAANTPALVRATGDVVVEGVIDVSGRAPVTAPGSSGWSSLGGQGGPGGTLGGSANGLVGLGGLGPSGAPGTTLCNAGGGGSLLFRGARGGSCACGGTPGAQLLNGSTILRVAGGGGGASWTSGGGGGGGGLVIAASGTITVDGVILAKGGAAVGGGGAGGGGNIGLVADVVDGDGVLDATSGPCGACAQGGCGAPGVIIIAATTRAGALYDNADPVPMVNLPAAPVPLEDLVVPTVRVSKIGTAAAPDADASAHPMLAAPVNVTAASQVTVEVEGQFVTPGVIAAVVVHGPDGSRKKVYSTRLVGTLEKTTATALITMPGALGDAMISAELAAIPYGFTPGCDPANPTPQPVRARCCADPNCGFFLGACFELTGSAYAGAAATAACQSIFQLPYAVTTSSCTGITQGACISQCGTPNEMVVQGLTNHTRDEGVEGCQQMGGVWIGP